MNNKRQLMEELISVIIPVFNAEQYLDHCIESVLSQTYQSLEIILIDDGSTDRSADICDRYVKMDDRVRYIHQHNLGVSAARNNGLKEARGKYICFVDSDDLLHPQFLEIAVRAMLEYDVLLVKAECAVFQGEDELSFSDLDVETIPQHVVSGREMLLRSFEPTRKTICAVWASLYERSLLQDLSFDENHLHEDFLFTFEVCARAKTVVSIDTVAYGYRQHGNSICHSKEFGRRQYDFLLVRVFGIEFLKQKMPALVEPAIADILSECMIMQIRIWSQEPSKGVEIVQNLISKIVRKYRPSLWLFFNPEINIRRKISILGTRISFPVACRIKAMMIR